LGDHRGPKAIARSQFDVQSWNGILLDRGMNEFTAVLSDRSARTIIVHPFAHRDKAKGGDPCRTRRNKTVVSWRDVIEAVVSIAICSSLCDLITGVGKVDLSPAQVSSATGNRYTSSNTAVFVDRDAATVPKLSAFTDWVLIKLLYASVPWDRTAPDERHNAIGRRG
jgi:hypothetical protein